MEVGETLLEFAAKTLLLSLAEKAGWLALRQACAIAGWPVAEQRPNDRSESTLPEYHFRHYPLAPASWLQSVPAASVLWHMPGRARLHVAGLRGSASRAAAAGKILHRLPGVTSAKVSVLTGNALVVFDPARLDVPAICAALEPGPVSRRRRCDGSVRPWPHLKLVSKH